MQASRTLRRWQLSSFGREQLEQVELLRFADLATDTMLLDWARELAPLMLDKHPDLAQRHIDRWLGTKAEYLKA